MTKAQGLLNGDHLVTISKRSPDGISFETPLYLSDEVLSISTSKRFGDAAGGFTISLTPKLWKRIASYGSNDMVQIWLYRPGAPAEKILVMTGLVNRISQAEEYGENGEPNIGVTITGWDLGKILVKHNIGWDISKMKIEKPNDPLAFRLANGMTMSGTPRACLESILRLVIGSVGPVKNPTPAQIPWLGAWFKFICTTTDDWETFDQSLPVRQGACWTSLRQFANIPWNFLSTETAGDGILKLTLEKAPFADESGKLQITKKLKDIPAEAIISTSLGVGDEERVNWFRYDASLYFQTVAGGESAEMAMVAAASGFTVYDEESVAIHGYCPLEISSAFAPFAAKPHSLMARHAYYKKAKTKDTFTPQYKSRIAAMWNRYKNIHLFRTGSIVIVGDPDIIGGDIIRTLDDGYLYFVENVAHSYTYGGDYVTTLQVSRGEQQWESGR